MSRLKRESSENNGIISISSSVAMNSISAGCRPTRCTLDNDILEENASKAKWKNQKGEKDATFESGKDANLRDFSLRSILGFNKHSLQYIPSLAQKSPSRPTPSFRRNSHDPLPVRRSNSSETILTLRHFLEENRMIPRESLVVHSNFSNDSVFPSAVWTLRFVICQTSILAIISDKPR